MPKRPWHRLPTPLALIKLTRFRDRLRQDNLHDTAQLPHNDPVTIPEPAADGSHVTFRTANGSFNDLDHPEMGMAGTRFGRNVPVSATHVDATKLMTPNPRVISRTLMTRDEFIPATSLNVLAAAWIQFQNHGWFNHGANKPDDKLEIPLPEGDDWPEEHRPMVVGKTIDDPTRVEGDTTTPPTFINTVSHWWDGSQVYGSSQEELDQLRSHADGKLRMDENGLLPLDIDGGIEQTGFNDNWWFGLSLLHTLFAKEHNLLCDHLKQQHPDWNDEWLFGHARLINAALMAKIHTVE
ncbi:peroxidase, partial [filamentous cyanobacterium CCP5]